MKGSYCGFENNEDSEKVNDLIKQGDSEDQESESRSERGSLSEKSEKVIKKKKKARRYTRKNHNFLIQNAFSINLTYISTANL